MGSPIKFVPGLLRSEFFDRRFLAAQITPQQQGYFAPATIDLRPQLLPSSHQGETAMCAAYAMAGWLEYYKWKYFGEVKQIDPEPIYTQAKKLDGYPNIEGTTLEAVVEAAQKLGHLNSNQITHIKRVQARDAPQALHRYGIILCGLDITENWLTADTSGWVSPGGASLGGHAVLLCAYSLRSKPPWYAFQNSWGTDHGWHGFIRLTSDIFERQFLYGLAWEVLPKFQD